MGGSVGLGNTTPAAEFNVYVDPEAAREVFGSGLPITMSGLDVTHQAGVGRAERDRLRGLGGIGEVVAGFLDFFAGPTSGPSASTPRPCTTPSRSRPSWSPAS
jgi:pyrimidine-specific ribonucleoside hydrolase